jgi:hypothetical protein
MKFVAIPTGCLNPQEIFLVYVKRLNRRQDHIAAGRVMSMKNSSDTNWNGTRDFRLVAHFLNQMHHRVHNLMNTLLHLYFLQFYISHS